MQTAVDVLRVYICVVSTQDEFWHERLFIMLDLYKAELCEDYYWTIIQIIYYSINPYFILFLFFLALWLLKKYIFCTFNTEFISKTFDHFCTHKGYNLSCSLCSKIIKVKELTHNPNSNLSQQTCFLIYLFFVWLYCCCFFFFVAVPLRIVRLSFPSHLAWNTRPKAPSPMSRTYSMLLRGYSSVRSLELSSRGRRWYMGFGWSLSSSSSEGRAVRVGTSMALLRTHNRSQTERARKSLTSCVETNHSVCLPDHYLCLFFFQNCNRTLDMRKS